MSRLFKGNTLNILKIMLFYKLRTVLKIKLTIIKIYLILKKIKRKEKNEWKEMR